MKLLCASLAKYVGVRSGKNRNLYIDDTGGQRATTHYKQEKKDETITATKNRARSVACSPHKIVNQPFVDVTARQLLLDVAWGNELRETAVSKLSSGYHTAAVV